MVTRAFGAERSAYQSLLRLCRAANRQPEHLVALRARPLHLYSQDLGKGVSSPEPHHFFVEDALCELAGGSIEFAHPLGCARAVTVVRRHRRHLRALGLNYLPDAQGILLDYRYRKRTVHSPDPWDEVA